MKQKSTKILVILIALILIVGAIMIGVKGLAFELKYQNGKQVEIDLGKEFDIKDMQAITNEVFGKQAVLIEQIEVYKDAANIITTDITEEQKADLVTKINEKYGTELSADNITIEEHSKIRGRDLIKPYIAMAQSYEKAGVNLEAGYEVVRRIKKHVASTSRLGVMGNIGAFGGMFDLSALKVKEPVLVSGTDGVGTKLKLAFEMDKHDTIGIDAVAMCVNDVLAQGAEPLVFLDYVAVGRNEPQKIEAIVAGVADGCRQAGCALVGGETAEMPGMYAEGEYDIAGFTVGVVEKSQLIDGSKVRAGDVLVGVASSGVHSNGFSLVRKIVADNCLNLRESYPELSNKQLGEVLLTPTKIYVKQVLEVVRNCDVHGISHITGGGFDENIPRILREGQGLEIDEGSWEILPVFRFLEKYGKVAHREMFNIFNMGIGMVIALDAAEAQKAIGILTEQGERATVIGRVTDTEGVVIR